MNAIDDKSLNSCKTNIRFILQLVLALGFMAKPQLTWASEDAGSSVDDTSSSSNVNDETDNEIQAGNPTPMNQFLGPNAAEPTGPYNRSYNQDDPYEKLITVANSLEKTCEHMLVTAQNSFLTTLEKLILYTEDLSSARYNQAAYGAHFQLLGDKVKPQITYYKSKIDSVCSQAFTYKKILLDQIRKGKTDTEFNEIKIAVSADELNEKSPNFRQKRNEAEEAFSRLRKTIPYGHSILNLTLQIEKNCQIIKSTPRPFLHFNYFNPLSYKSGKSYSIGDIRSEAMKQDDKDEFSFKNNLDEQVDLLDEKIERIDIVEHHRNEMALKKEILQAIDRAKKTCEYKPKEKRLQTKKNKTANPIEVSPTSAPITAAQEKQLLDDAIHFILNPATDWYSNEVTTMEHINNEMKAAKYLIQKKEQYSSTILQLSQNPTDNNKNNSTSNNKASASNYKTKNQAVKKVAESKKSKEEKIKAYQKWVDYLDYLIQQNQATWKARCDKGFNEELCQQYPWSPGVP